MEQWKDIPGYEGLYQASNMGLIRSAPGKVTSNKRYNQRVWKTRILQHKFPKKSRRKDPRVSLWKDGKSKGYLVSRLVAMTWVDGYRPDLTVNHIDGNYLNNNISNLEWVTRSENIRKGHKDGLMPGKHPIVLKLLDVEFSFDSLASASEFLGRNKGYVHCCLKRNAPIKDIEGNSYIFTPCR